MAKRTIFMTIRADICVRGTDTVPDSIVEEFIDKSLDLPSVISDDSCKVIRAENVSLVNTEY